VIVTISIPLPSADRPMWFPGQVLTADDLTATQDVDTGLRRLHHRMLHGWGIAFGLAVTGRRGQAQVEVGAGYALDGRGTELVLPHPVPMPVPPVAGGPDGGPRHFTLVLRWTEDEDAFTVDRPGACGTEGAVRRSDAPTLSWVDPGEVRVGLDIVLAEVRVQSCRLVDPPGPTLRRLLNPPPTPYTATGRTPAGDTDWNVVADQGEAPWALQVTVDTSEAGFGDTPTYLARVAGPRLVEAGLTAFGQPFLLDGPAHIEAPEPGRFQLLVPLVPRVWTAGDPDPIRVNPAHVVGGDVLYDLVAHQLRWTVEWVGVQA
jgi:hypothetical protein